MNDTELLDLLEKNAKPGMGWVCRDSVMGRGLRLHQVTTPIGEPYELGGKVQPDPRAALREYMELKGS